MVRNGGGVVGDVAEHVGKPGPEVRHHAHSHGVLRASGEQRRTSRRTDRGDVEVGELQAVRSNCIDVARVDAAIDAADVALVAFPGAVPQFPVHPRHAGDEAVGLDGAKNRPGFGIDLVDLARAMLADPQRAFGPCHAGVAAIARGRDGAQHLAGARLDRTDRLSRVAEIGRGVARLVKPFDLVAEGGPDNVWLAEVGSDAGGSGVAMFQCQLDGGTYSACTSPATITVVYSGRYQRSKKAFEYSNWLGMSSMSLRKPIVVCR